MKRIWLIISFLISHFSFLAAQTFETKYARPVHDVMQDVSKRFGVRL